MAEQAGTFEIKFWGTRGSLATPGPNTVRYGGNTACVEFRCDSKTMVFDGGTGIADLGRDLMARGGLDVLHMFLTHTHLDHIIGLPFFAPFHQEDLEIHMWAGHLLPDRSLFGTLSDMMMAPLFPVPPGVFKARVNYHDFEAGEDIFPCSETKIRTCMLNHPNDAVGYRVDYDGKSACYITDTEHFDDKLDENILGLVQDADIMIYDATYTDAEYPKYRGFGHSTWQEGVKLADAANVKTLVIFHHEPTHTDDIMDQIAKDAEAARPGTIVAREGLVITL